MNLRLPLTLPWRRSDPEASGAANPGLFVLLGQSRVTLSRLWCYAGIRQVLPGSQSRRRPETHRRGQPLQSEASNAKNAPESAICSVSRKRANTTVSVVWLVPISSPRNALHRVGRTNLPSDALPFRIPHSALRISPDGAARLIDRHRREVRIGGVEEGHGNWVASSSSFLV